MSSTTTTSAVATSNNKRTRLDRSLPIILPDANDTPSRRDGVDGPTERLYRLYGSSLLQQACTLLGVTAVRPSTAVTAAVIWQRLYHCISLRTMDVWAAAMGSLLCAAKTEEVPLTARQIVVVFHHLYRRRRLLLVDKVDQFVQYNNNKPKDVIILTKQASTLSLAEKQQVLQSEGVLPMSSTGPIWKEWFDALVQAEGVILRSLGFLLYWIPNEHAHRFVPGFCEALGLLVDNSNNAVLIQRIWNACNDAYRLDACVRFSAEIICAAAIFLVLTTNTTNTTAPPKAPSDPTWWIPLIGPGQEQALVDCANILASSVRSRRQQSEPNETTSDDSVVEDPDVASVAFLKPLVAESFNGPGSFVWEMAEGNL
eukprot:scaffold2033_cov164-Amphora_coffeaeformis.AAC.1